MAGRLTGMLVEEDSGSVLLRFPAAILERPVIEESGDKAVQRVSFNHLSMVDGELYRLYKSGIRGEFRSTNPALVDAYTRYVTAYMAGAFAINPYDKVEVLIAQGEATAEPVSADTKVIPLKRETQGDAPPHMEVVHQPHTGPVATEVRENTDGVAPV